MSDSLSDKTVLRDAIKRVEIAWANPDLSDNERCVFEMHYLRGWDDKEVCASLVMTPKEYRATKAELWLKILKPLPVYKKPPEQMEAI